MKKNKPNTRDTLSQAIEVQYSSKKPQEIVGTYRRLRKAGYEDDAIRDMCVWVLATEYFRILSSRESFDIERYAWGLRRLPTMPWDDDGSGYPCDVTQEDVQETILDNPNLLLETVEQTRERYSRIRPKLSDIQNELMYIADPSMLQKSAQVLGVMQGKTMVLDSEDVLSVIADHCIYAHPGQRRKLVNAYRKKHKSIDSETAELLRAIQEAQYLLLYCEEVIPGLGVYVRNALTNDTFRLVDLNLAESVEAGIVLATHIVSPYGMSMTTGAPLPILDRAAMEDVIKIVERHIERDDMIASGEFVTQIVRTLLRHEAMDHMQYE